MESKEFKWEQKRYNKTREHHDGVPCGGFDTVIAYGLVAFSGIACALACGIGILLMMARFR
jgi:hypothetical protein